MVTAEIHCYLQTKPKRQIQVVTGEIQLLFTNYTKVPDTGGYRGDTIGIYKLYQRDRYRWSQRKYNWYLQAIPKRQKQVVTGAIH